jgi:hypothetical protein
MVEGARRFKQITPEQQREAEIVASISGKSLTGSDLSLFSKSALKLITLIFCA